MRPQNRLRPPKPLPLTPLDKWKIRALQEANLLEDAEWIQAAAFRVTDGHGQANANAGQAYVQGLFQRGFQENPATVSVSRGMSTGGIACTKSWEGARKYLDAKGQYLFLVAAEGFYLPSVDRQNRSYEIMCHRVPSWNILAAARIDEIDSEYGQLFSLRTDAICFNHGFRRPAWLPTDKLKKKLEQYIQKLGGLDSLDLDEYRAICGHLGIAPSLLQ